MRGNRGEKSGIVPRQGIVMVEADYKVIHKTVRYRLKSKLKVPRPVSVKQPEGATEDFKKLPRLLKSINEF